MNFFQVDAEVIGTIKSLVYVTFAFLSVVGIATCYGWTVRRSNPGGGEIFLYRPDRHWGPPSLLYNGYLVFPGVKAGGAVFDTHHDLVSRLKEV